jgi:TnsA endonuclease N terminal/TnsA endonuclease C terminal
MRISSRQVRRIRGRTDGGTGFIPNAGRYESLLERDYYTLLRIDPEVESFQPQPIKVPYTDKEGRHRKYCPDVLVRFRPSQAGSAKPSCLVEVKPLAKLAHATALERLKLDAGIRFASANGWTFAVVTEREIRTTRLENAKFLVMFVDRVPSPITRARMLVALGELPAADPDMLLASLCKDKWNCAEQIPVLWHLIVKGEIGVDLSKPLTMKSPIWVPEER